MHDVFGFPPIPVITRALEITSINLNDNCGARCFAVHCKTFQNGLVCRDMGAAIDTERRA